MSATVIVGAGAAGLACAKRLRELDADRRIVLVDKDRDAPYERPPLSKGLAGAGAKPNGAAGLVDASIELVSTAAEGIDLGAHALLTATGAIAYDELVLAPGSTPSRPHWANDDVLSLHSHADSLRLRDRVRDARSVVVVGGGYVGAEVAASLAAVGVAVTLVFRDRALFGSRLGGDVSALLTALHEEAGVLLVAGAEVERVDGRFGEMTVILSDQRRIDTDLVVVGIGSVPDTGWLSGSGLLGQDGRIAADACLRVADAVWAAGDSVSWQVADGVPTTSAHWTAARSQGRQIAEDIVRDTATPFLELPYFWSMQHGHLVQGIGAIDPKIADVDTVRGGTETKPGVLTTFRVDGVPRGAVAVNDPRGFLAVRAELDELALASRRAW